MNWISALMNDWRGLPCPFYQVKTQKKATYAPGSRLSPDTKSASALILNFPAFRTVRNKCWLFKPPSHGIFVVAAQTD